MKLIPQDYLIQARFSILSACKQLYVATRGNYRWFLRLIGCNLPTGLTEHVMQLLNTHCGGLSFFHFTIRVKGHSLHYGRKC